jgi:hypothetical protein
LVDLFKEIYQIWVSERPNQLAAALAYFGLFSFAPVIYVALSIAGIFFDEAAVWDRFLTRLETALGPGVSQAVQEMVNNVSVPGSSGSFLVSLISFFLLLLAASGVFFQLQFVQYLESPYIERRRFATDGTRAPVLVFDGDQPRPAVGRRRGRQPRVKLVKLHIHSIRFSTLPYGSGIHWTGYAVVCRDVQAATGDQDRLARCVGGRRRGSFPDSSGGVVDDLLHGKYQHLFSPGSRRFLCRPADRVLLLSKSSSWVQSLPVYAQRYGSMRRQSCYQGKKKGG